MIGQIQKAIVLVLAAMLVIVVVLSTLHLGVLIAHDAWQTPRFLMPVDGLLDIFGYFLLVLIGVELLEAQKAYLNKESLHVRVVVRWR